MAELLTPDICVIGGGSGGLSVAAAAAALGASVVLIEKGRMGGDCLNTGCVPSKALLASAKRADALRKAASFGLGIALPSVDFAKVHTHVHHVIAAIAPNDSTERFTALGVRVIAGTARFRDRRTVVVGDEIEVQARRFVIATGSSPAVPAIPGLETITYLTNETVFDLSVPPRHLIVIGGGPVGIEMAQAFRRLGAEVTVIEAVAPLRRDDPECSAIVLDQLGREGVRLLSPAKVLLVQARGSAGDGIFIKVGTGGGEVALEGSHILVATGRQANLDQLDLVAAGINAGPQGIVVDRRLRTSNRKVYAIGDVVGGPHFTHLANFHAGLVIRHALFRLPVNHRGAPIPWVTFTDPELAHVGLTEAQARERRRAIRVLRWPYHENDRAQAERETRGHIKVVTAKDGRIMGATIVGAHAGELITVWTLAMAHGLKIAAIAGIMVPYPTLAEIGKRAAITYFTPGLTSPWLRRTLAFMRRFG